MTSQANRCGVDKPHLVVLDTLSALKGEPRTVPGNCYCVRCGELVELNFDDVLKRDEEEAKRERETNDGKQPPGER